MTGGLFHARIKDLADPVVISPDAGGVYRAKKFRDELQKTTGKHNIPLAMIVKQRAKANEISQMDLVGDVVGKDCILVDDMIDTAGTLCKAAETLKSAGGNCDIRCIQSKLAFCFIFDLLHSCVNTATRVFAFASHGLFSGPASERITASCLEQVVVANTIPLDGNVTNKKIVHVRFVLACTARPNIIDDGH